MRGTVKLFVTLALVCVASGVEGISPPQGASPKAAPAKEWPDARTLDKRRLESEKLPLFGAAEPLAITLTADFKAIQSDRNPESTKVFPATIQFPGAGGSRVTIDLNLRTRGHARRSY